MIVYAGVIVKCKYNLISFPVLCVIVGKLCSIVVLICLEHTVFFFVSSYRIKHNINKTKHTHAV